MSSFYFCRVLSFHVAHNALPLSFSFSFFIHSFLSFLFFFFSFVHNKTRALSQTGFGLVSEEHMPFTCEKRPPSCDWPYMPSEQFLENLERANYPTAYVNFSCTCLGFTSEDPSQGPALEKMMQALLMTVSFLPRQREKEEGGGRDDINNRPTSFVL